MHSFGETDAGVPAFLAKLWRLVEEPETNNLIGWSKDGRSFLIQNQSQFARELLPLNYKHNNMASFIRQLNMYGFHKITSIDNGGLRFDRDEMEFTHPCFKRNNPHLLQHIKRKIASSKSIDDKTAVKPEAVTKVLQDVKAMRGRQDSLDSRFSAMKQENETLWREIASLRQKHAKQQQIVNKLIQFLITIVQPHRNMTSVKRHMQLMINDIPDSSKMRKNSESETDCGPVIHELGEDLLEDVSEVDPELMMPNSPFVRVTSPATSTTDPVIAHSPNNVEDPSNVSLSPNFDLTDQSIAERNTSSTGISINDGLIQTVNNDGSKIFYHITEVPDVQHEEANISVENYNEDNILITPMVQEIVAPNQLPKQKSRQKRAKNLSTLSDSLIKGTGSSITKKNNVSTQEKTSPKKQYKNLRIKTENDSSIDPMLFLNVYSNNSSATPELELISPNYSEDSRHSNSISSTIPPVTDNSDLYNPNNFITNDIPTFIFEDDSANSIEENSHIGEIDNYKKDEQQQFRGNFVNSGKLSTYSRASTSGKALVLPSTSAASSFINKNNSTDIPESTSSSSLKEENCINMALAKYKSNPNLMRLSKADEVSGHLEVVQDELEGLKELLRSDVYSLDNNTLLGLFNDADILGMQLTSDGSGSYNRKGSELMTYQPMYDLSDIISEQNDLDGAANIPTTSTSQAQQQEEQEFNSFVLNTPHHE